MKFNQDIDKQVAAFLDEVLKTSPQCSLSSSFAEEITKKVYNTFLWKSYLKEFFISVGSALFIAAIALGVLYYIDVDFVQNIITIILENKLFFGMILMIVIVLFLYNYVLLDFMLYYYKKKLSKN